MYGDVPFDVVSKEPETSKTFSEWFTGHLELTIKNQQSHYVVKS